MKWTSVISPQPWNIVPKICSKFVETFARGLSSLAFLARLWLRTSFDEEWNHRQWCWTDHQCRRGRDQWLWPSDVWMSVFVKVFVEILRSDTNPSQTSSSPIDPSIATMSYHELIRHFLLTETQYKDDIELLIKLFRNPIRQILSDEREVRISRRSRRERTSLFSSSTMFSVVWMISLNWPIASCPISKMPRRGETSPANISHSTNHSRILSR